MKWVIQYKASILFLIINIFSLPVFANLPYFPIQFPRDDAAHYANVPYQIKNLTEWWYYNGKLTSTTGRRFGYFVAIFHIVPSNKQSPYAVLMVQLTDVDNQKVYGTKKVYADNQASFATDQLNIRLAKDLTLKKSVSSYLFNQDITIPGAPKIKLTLELTPVKLPLLINRTGQIDMYDGTNSYYYSHVRMRTDGIIQVGDEVFTANGDSKDNSSWMDHQWGDFILSPQKSRWVWASVQLDNGMDLSAWELIDPASHRVMWKLGNVIMPDDSRFYTTDIDIQEIAGSQRSTYPARYSVKINPLKLQLTLDSMAPHQESNGFWEGIHAATGWLNDDLVQGFAYVENTVKHDK